MAHPIADNKYLSLTSYKRDGSAKALPVWVVPLGDAQVGFTTASSSFKVKRIRNNPAVLLQPSNAKGDPTEGTEIVAGQARVVTGEEFERVRSLVKDKYGLQFAMINVVGKLAKLVRRGSGTDCAVVIDL